MKISGKRKAIIQVYLLNSSHDSVPVPSEVLHITVNDELPQPFSMSQIERVFESDGNNKHVNGISTGLYYNHTLLLGTMFTGMMVCEVNYLLY